MPSLAELKAAYPDMDEGALRAAWAQKHPNEPLTGPSVWQRIKDFAMNPMVTKTAGITGGMAAAGSIAGVLGAPETGGASLIPMIAAMLGGAGGSMLGGEASRAYSGEDSSLAKTGMDAVEGASTPLIGPALKGGATVLRGVGDMIPPWVKAVGLYSHPVDTLATMAATHRRGLPLVMDTVGDGANWLARKASGLLSSPEAEATVSKAAGQSREIPYQMRAPTVTSVTKVPRPELPASVKALEAPRSAPVAPTPTEAPLPTSVQDLMTETGPQRPLADYVHPADTSGKEFGFDELPEISEGELSRLQELFKRVGGKP